MKNLFKIGFCAVMALLTFVACSDDDNMPKQPSVKVEVLMPPDFTAKFAGEVVISSKDLNKTYKAQAENGVATFESVYPGIYDVQIQAKMTKQEAQAAAPSLHFQSGIILSGVAKGVDVKLGATTNVTELQINLTWNNDSPLLISKIYGNGTRNNNDGINNAPKYWEIYNNSSEVVYLDGLCLAQAHGLTTSEAPCKLYQLYQNEATFASRIAKMPGIHGKDKNIALEGGKSLVIAWNASNFIIPENTSETATDKCTMNVDLTGADYEIFSTGFFWKKFGDNTDVPNMEPIYDCVASAGFLQMNQALFIFFATEEEVAAWATDVDDSSYTVASQKKWAAKRVPNEIILDAVETYKAGDVKKQQKRIPDMLDAKGIEASNNTGSIFDRKVQSIAENGRKVLQDTNNSFNDFVVVESRNAEAYDGSHLVIRDYDKPEIQPKN